MTDTAGNIAPRMESGAARPAFDVAGSSGGPRWRMRAGAQGVWMYQLVVETWMPYKPSTNTWWQWAWDNKDHIWLERGEGITVWSPGTAYKMGQAVRDPTNLSHVFYSRYDRVSGSDWLAERDITPTGYDGSYFIYNGGPDAVWVQGPYPWFETGTATDAMRAWRANGFIPDSLPEKLYTISTATAGQIKIETFMPPGQGLYVLNLLGHLRDSFHPEKGVSGYDVSFSGTSNPSDLEVWGRVRLRDPRWIT